MEGAALLSPSDITTIRRYVQTKYAPLPDGRRAEIVADAIRRTLERRLPNIPDELKGRMVDQLIARCLIGERRDVRPEDVIDLFSEIADDETIAKEQWLDPIMQWANARTPGRWSPEQLASRLERRHANASAAIIQIVPAEEAPQIDRTPALSEWLVTARGKLRRLASPVPAIALAAAIAIGVGGAIFSTSGNRSAAQEEAAVVDSPIVASIPEPSPDVGMPDYLKYSDIDAAPLIEYLNSRDSLLADEPYFGAIMDNARKYDIHPLLLFAITGQEQGFVPRTSKDAKLIANNPFNVGHSWMEYNTDIDNSAGIASRLIVKLAESRPEGHDPFLWFNKTYAEDPLWSEGVRKIFNKLSGLTANETKR